MKIKKSRKFPSLTLKQAKVYSFIVNYHLKNGIVPTHEEIAGEIKTTTGSAQSHILGLVRKGFLTRNAGSRRMPYIINNLEKKKNGSKTKKTAGKTG